VQDLKLGLGEVEMRRETAFLVSSIFASDFALSVGPGFLDWQIRLINISIKFLE